LYVTRTRQVEGRSRTHHTGADYQEFHPPPSSVVNINCSGTTDAPPVVLRWVARLNCWNASRIACAGLKQELGSVNEKSVSAKRKRYPMPSSSAVSSGVPHLRQMTAEQSPQVSGSVISTAHCGQYSVCFPLLED